ncbi:hypothetical protein MB27_25300, partial [Actinoplanes utahensis]
MTSARTLSLSRRTFAAFAVALSVTAGTVVVDASLTAPPAAAASVAGGTITRSEVLARAEAWYSRRHNADMTYSQELKTSGATSDRNYRRDCSGLVDMAWHLNADPNTQGLMNTTITKAITRNQLLPGDLLNDVVNNDSGYPYHAILFGGWENAAKTSFWYYSFGGTPMKKVTGASFSDSILAGHATSQYAARRYVNIVDDAAPVE